MSENTRKHLQKAVKVAYHILFQNTDRKMTPLILNKLVFFAHGWKLGITGEPLIDDESVQAWKYGPVWPSVYQEFKEYEGRSIRSLGMDYSNILKDDLEYINFSIQAYSDFKPYELVSITHIDGSPWEQVYENGIKSIKIPNNIIKNYYRGKAES